MNRTMSNFIWIYANTILLIVGFIFRYNENFYYVLSLIGALQLLLVLYINIKTENKLFSPLIIYEVVMYLFLFGQCLMWIFTEEYSGRNIIELYNAHVIVKAEIFTLVSMFFFHLALFCTKGRTIKTFSDIRIMQLKAAMYQCGKILLCITIVPEIVYNIRIFIIARSYGYAGIYDVTTSSALQVFLNLREFFFPAVVMVLCGDIQGNHRLKNFLVGIIVLDAFVSLYVGSRSDAMMQILSLVLILQVVNNKQGKQSKKTIVKFILLFAILIIVANVVRVIRIIPNKEISTFFKYLLEPDAGNNDNMIVEIIGELGGTMATLIETMILVPKAYNHLNGTSYLYALTWILPGFLTNNIWEKASMNNWIDTVRYTGSGWGFSTTAEAYFNFGYMGVLVFIIIGYFVGKLFKRLDRGCYEKNPVEFALSFILFNRLLIFSRIDFLSTLPSIIYFYFCIKALIYIVDYINQVKGG